MRSTALWPATAAWSEYSQIGGATPVRRQSAPHQENPVPDSDRYALDRSGPLMRVCMR
jgi:hypothetical protein